MPAKANEIQLTRVYDAPVELVWEVWTDLDHVEKWWGPRGFSLTTHSKELRPGGRWVYTMHGPDGTDYPNITTYHEVVKHKRLVYDHGGNEDRQKLFTVTVDFQERHGQTIMTVTSTLPTEAEAKAMRRFIKDAGGNSTWDRLGEHLEQKTKGVDAFVINRSFAADAATTFRMGSDPTFLVRWLAANASDVKISIARVDEGEISRWSISTPGGASHGVLQYLKVHAPYLVTYSQRLCDEDGRPSTAPNLSNHPTELLFSVSFAEEGPAETRVTVHSEIAGEATSAARQAFHGMKTAMANGWNHSFDRLDEFIAEPIQFDSPPRRGL